MTSKCGVVTQAYSSSEFLSGISDMYKKKFPEIKNYFGNNLCRKIMVVQPFWMI